MKKIALLTCNFNNELLTKTMLMSFFKQSGLSTNDIDIYVMDNSDKNKIVDLSKYFNIIDNFNYRLTPNLTQPSKNHCVAIDYAFKHIDADYVILCDNDILFTPSLKTLLQNIKYDFDVYGEIGYDVIKPARLFPYFCIINLKKFKQEKLNYFDNERCMKLFDASGKELVNTRFGHHGLYDTGYSFYEDIKNRWTICNIKINDYIVHLKGAALHNKNVTDWLDTYKYLFM